MKDPQPSTYDMALNSIAHAPRPINALTIDVEDWAQACVDPSLEITSRFVHNTRLILSDLAAANVRATFFVLGLAAEKAPYLIREILQVGHEVQCHGYGHRLLQTLTPSELRTDLNRAKKLLEDLTGSAITAYRAPAFSVTDQTPWALDVIAECGFTVDASIFPIRMRRYGMNGVPRHPHRLRTPGGAELIEVPVASYHAFGRTWPTGGGGYLRLLPYRMFRRGIAQLNAECHPAVIYLHPHEYDRDGLIEYQARQLRESRTSFKVRMVEPEFQTSAKIHTAARPLTNAPSTHPERPSPLTSPGGRVGLVESLPSRCLPTLSWTRRLHQGLGRRGVPEKIRRLLAEFSFAPLREVLKSSDLNDRMGLFSTGSQGTSPAPSIRKSHSER